jgi:pimeloyl-ACP methyl ester carboxylesterase
MGQENLDEFGATLLGESPLRTLLEVGLPTYQAIQADEIVGAMATLLPDVDRAFCTDEFGDYLATSFREAVSVGVDGWIDDDLAFAAPWGFDLGAISVPVSVWQGSDDLMVPFAHGRWLADAIPGARAHLLEGEGHLSVVVGRIGDILDELL